MSVAAYTDALTGTGNRLHLSRQLAKATAFPDKPFGLLFLDLEKFKQLNDRYGHEAGDEVLRVVAARLVAAARSDDVVAQFGGDEFVLLLAGVDSNASLMSRAERIHERLVKPMRLQAGVGQIGVNIGGTLFPSGGSDERGLLAAAEKAMYAAKRKGAWFGI